MKKVIFVSIVGLFLTSCTKNQNARTFGGTEEVALNPNEVVINVTWKQNDMWICTKDTIKNIFYFREKSNYGFLEGVIVFKSK